MTNFNPQNRPRLLFIIEPDDEKRRLSVAASLLEKHQDEEQKLTRRFFFEQTKLPEIPEQEEAAVDPVGCRRLLFNPEVTTVPFGSRWLEWTNNIRTWKDAQLRVGVDSFHRLISEPDTKSMLEVRESERVSQLNAERFFIYLSAEHHSSIEYVLGVASLEWLLVFLGVGSVRAHNYAVKELLDHNLRGENGIVTQPSDFMRQTLSDQGADELSYNRYSLLLFPTDAPFPVQFGQNRITPPEELVAGAEDFYQFQAAVDVWSLKRAPADGKSLARVLCRGNGSSSS